MDKKDWKPLSFDEACEVSRRTPISFDMSYEERLSIIKSRFGL